MKKIIVLIFFTIFSLGNILSVNAEYKEDQNYFIGEIISINVKNDEITIYDYSEKVKRTFFVENGIQKDLKPGVEVMVSSLKGTNTAKKVKLIVPRNINI